MFNWSHSLDIPCDAPSYSIVKACRMVGVRTPEDVRWCRLSHFRKGRHARLDLFSLQTWKFLLGMSPENSACSCGQELPRLEEYTFTSVSGKETRYLIGQCARCRTVFWEEA